MLDSYIMMIHEIECFWFVKIWLTYALLLVVLCLIFCLWWSCLDTGADGAADGYLGDNLGWRMPLGLVLYFEKLVFDIINMFWNFSLALCNLDAC